jgi:ferredoxin
MRYTCFYYSATGNTERAVTLLRRKLEAAGSTVDVTRIRKGVRAPDIGGYDGVIVAFPVLSFAPPVFVKRFIRSIPEGKGLPAHVLAVDGGGGRSAAALAVRLLERRGFRAVVSGRATYVENWTQAFQPPGPEAVAVITAQGDAMAVAFAEAVLSGKPGAGSVDRKVSVIDTAVGFLFGAVGRRFFGKVYYADEDCNACGLCVRGCPSGTILLAEGKRARPFWKADCEDCNACINMCPTRAINTSIGRLVVLLSFILAAAWAGIGAYFKYAKPLIAGAIPPALCAGIDMIAVLVVLYLAHALPIGPVDRYFLRFVQRIPGVRKFFSWTFTKSWRRYRAGAV